MSFFRTIAAALDLKNAGEIVKMGLKQNQLGGVLRGYFGGMRTGMLSKALAGNVDISDMLKTARGTDMGYGTGAGKRAAYRIGTAAVAGFAASRVLPQNDALAAVGAAGAFYGAYKGLGGYGTRAAEMMMGRELGESGARVAAGATGLMAGSMVWSGMRTQRPADFMMRG